VRRVKPISAEIIPNLTKKGTIRVSFISASGPEPEQGAFPGATVLISKTLQRSLLIGTDEVHSCSDHDHSFL
jgi:hypothetical protein